MYTNIEYSAIVVQSPCFLLPLSLSLWSLFISLYLLGTLLAAIGSCLPWSQVARKLISPFPSPSPYTPLSKIPTPWGFPELNMHITKTISRTWFTRSSTLGNLYCCTFNSVQHWWLDSTILKSVPPAPHVSILPCWQPSFPLNIFSV